MTMADGAKWTENTLGEGEIACYEQFLPFPSVFTRHDRHVKTRANWERV